MADLVLGVSGRFSDCSKHDESHSKAREGGNDEDPPPTQRLRIQHKVEAKGHAVSKIDPPVVQTKSSPSIFLQ